ncbi:hypothetical protein [Corynebacterium efficiens]|uniref:HTH cro/C1-type domain-containing protein n=1 Tax=Corynebacterium efficiens (strain DSM 44549 / YS-314 / AJ 12310 / JCM 11189 / NBRC 100395) TaxID=196164 RepID=Q8FRD8_COREF|nr:hypothetical protein [Corynebacterium efficiens]BAC17633.1 hypothetical protein [Corynebacterium efficiens YS-314]
MNFIEWLNSLPGSPTPTLAANHSGLAGPTLIRHAQRGKTTADNVIKIAKAYGVSPIDALVELGFLSPEDVSDTRIPLKSALEEAGVSELLESLVKRVNASGLFEGTFDARFFAGRAGAEIHELPSRIEQKDVPDAQGNAYDDDDAILDGINAGTEKFAAQESTEPLDETWT